MNRRLFTLLSGFIALMALVLGSAATSSVALAQNDVEVDACCVLVKNTTNCHITVCVNLADGTTRCITVPANSRDGFRFPCCDGFHFTVTGACETKRIRVGTCVDLLLRGGCCGHVCLNRGADGCYEFVVTENPNDVCTCP